MDRRTEDRVDRSACTHLGDVARLRSERHDRSVILQPDDAMRDRWRRDDVDESRAAGKDIDAGGRSGGDRAPVWEFVRIDAEGCGDGLKRGSDDARPRAELVVVPADAQTTRRIGGRARRRPNDAPNWWSCVGRGFFRAWPRYARSKLDDHRV